MRAKIAVVGGGVMGVSIALHAARRCDPLTEPVVLLERRQLAAGSSGRSGAILRQFYSHRVPAAMARDSLRTYSGLQVKTGRYIGFVRTGVLTIAGAGQAAEQELVRQNVAMLTSIGVDARLVDAAEMRELMPDAVVADGSVGAWEPEAGLVDPVRTVETLAALARDGGATTRMSVEVEEILIEGDRAVGVRAGGEVIQADQVVLAAGPWSRALLSRAGIELPLRVVRPEQHFLAMPAGDVVEDDDDLPTGDTEFLSRIALDAVRVRAPHPVLLDLEHGHYAKPEPLDERTRVGRMDYDGDQELDDPDELVEEVSPVFQRAAREALCARLPVYRDQKDRGSEAAWYTLTPDAQAIIGRVPGVEGLVVCTGFSGHGFKLAPSVGEGVAQMLFGDPVSAFDPAFFAPERFAGGAWEEPSGRFGL